MSQYVPVGIAFLAAIGLGMALWLVATILGPSGAHGGVRVGKRKSETNEDPFECGVEGTPFRRRFNVKFYVVALLFVLFDVEAVFLYPLATVFQSLGGFALLAMLVFLAIVTLGLIYEWKKGALEWT